ncbi:MAG: HEAT repeat domain-containing protein [Planctomycetes bacterium]|nr:HEAT repeat domain-containing protein [Planctomycetota bacterium]
MNTKKWRLFFFFPAVFIAQISCSGGAQEKPEINISAGDIRMIARSVPDLLLYFSSRSPKDWNYAYEKLMEIKKMKDLRQIMPALISGEMDGLLPVAIQENSSKAAKARERLVFLGKVYKLLSKFDSRNPEDWTDARKSLATLGDEAVQMTVLALISNFKYAQNPMLWERARNELTAIGVPALKPLLAAVASQKVDDVTMEQCITVMILMGEPAQNQLLLIYKEGNAEMHKTLAKALRCGFTSEHTDLLIKLAGHADWIVRGEAINSMGAMRMRAFAPILLKALADSDSYVQRTSAKALMELKEPGAVKPLILLLGTTRDYETRNAAVLALTTITKTNFGTDFDKWMQWFETSPYNNENEK